MCCPIYTYIYKEKTKEVLSVWATILLVLEIIRHNWNSIMSIFYWRWPFLKIQQSPFSFQFPFYVLLHALCSFLLVGSCRFLTPVCAHRRLRQNLPHTLLGHKSLLLYMRNEGSFSAESTSREIITASQLIIFGSIAPKHHPCQWIFFFYWIERIVRCESPVYTMWGILS